MRIFKIIIFLLCLVSGKEAGAKRPKLVVNIVVSQMRYDYLSRFEEGFSKGGFNKFRYSGTVFTDAHYNFMQTITPATLATITTGANPSTHGVVSERWVDYTTNQRVSLIDDKSASGVDCDRGVSAYSGANLTTPTLGDRLKEQSPQSKVVTVATSPLSSVVMGGQGSHVYWMNDSNGDWVSSSAYLSALPRWVQQYNELRIPAQYINDYRWTLVNPNQSYLSSIYSVIDLNGDSFMRRLFTSRSSRSDGRIASSYGALMATPVGSSLTLEFVKQAILYEELGRDEHTDLLNICFDSPRYAGTIYGSESMEVEDMFYRLDRDIEELMVFLSAQVDMSKTVVVITSDHGVSDSYDQNPTTPKERFNTAQFSVIVNGFMNSQYGTGDWVLDYCDRQLFLNRNLIYKNGLSLEEIQNRVAAFALQFRGVSHVLTSTAMQSSYFSGSYAEKIQNSFYPKRSGDITINLMPGWIEERQGERASSGSMYEYDTHVPLMVLGSRIYTQNVTRRVDMCDLAPTLARIMGIGQPIAAEGVALEEAVSQY